MNVKFFVPGTPKPQGSMKPIINKKTGTAFVKHSEGVMTWRGIISSHAMQHCVGLKVTEGPLLVKLVFYLSRPKNHYGTGRNSDKLKPGAPKVPAKKPDIDKLIRAVLDALTGVVFKDDEQVVTCMAWKMYSEKNEPGVYVDVCTTQAKE